MEPSEESGVINTGDLVDEVGIQADEQPLSVEEGEGAVNDEPGQGDQVAAQVSADDELATETGGVKKPSKSKKAKGKKDSKGKKKQKAAVEGKKKMAKNKDKGKGKGKDSGKKNKKDKKDKKNKKG